MLALTFSKKKLGSKFFLAQNTFESKIMLGPKRFGLKKNGFLLLDVIVIVPY